jgi:hypothetical protein
VEQPGPRAGVGRLRPRGGRREDVVVLVVEGEGRRVGGRGGGGIKVDGDGSGAERANAGTGLVRAEAEALGVDCPSSVDSELDRPRLASGSGAVCWMITGGGGVRG